MTLGQRIAVLKAGELQQVDEPRGLYERPANRFVAGFLGSPSMNFLPATLGADGVPLEVGGQRLRRPEHWPSGEGGRRVVLGIRPEHVSLGAGAWGALPGTLGVRELLGNEVLLHADTPAGLLVLRAAPEVTAQVGDRVTLGLDLSRAHLFDPESGETLV